MILHVVLFTVIYSMTLENRNDELPSVLNWSN